MPCDINDISITEPTTPGIPGFGPIAPFPQIPFPDIALPEGFPEDLLQLIEDFLALFPSNIFRPNLDNFSKDIVDAIVSLLNQIAPYLGLYKFFIALLNMIICIIGVLCALVKPRQAIKALRQLFRKCLPDFLNLFPWLALIAMIIALLLMLIAIIQYILAQILRLIAEIIRNIQIFTDAVSRNDAEKTLAAARKLASLACLMENLFAVLLAFGAVFDIIRALAEVGVNSVCGNDNDLQGVDVGCCPTDVCPDFIALNSGSFPPGTLGRLIFHKEILQDTSLLGAPVTVPPIRSERHQFVDTETGKTFNLKDIITGTNTSVIIGDTTLTIPKVFFPPTVFDPVTSLEQVPYTLDVRFFADANILSSFNISGAPRFVRIKNMIIKQAPTIGVLNFDDTVSTTPDTGTVLPTGGVVFEDDGVTPINDSTNRPASLETLLTQPSAVGLPATEDGYVIDNVEFTAFINEEALVTHNLITIGCTLRTDRAILNDTLIGNVVPPIFLIDFPDITGASDCLLAGTRKFRDNLSLDGAAELQADTQACLDLLNDQALTAYEQAVCAGFNRFGSTVTATPSPQFINLPIQAGVSIKDSSGTSLINGMPASVQSTIAAKLSATVTLGEISGFTYDGYQQLFVADITSDTGGDGELRVSFAGETLANLIGNDNLVDEIAVEELVVPYTFVSSGLGVDAGDGAAGRLPGVRRDEGDVSRDESS